MEGKVLYNAEDIFHSETWDIQAYITYTDKGGKRKSTKKAHKKDYKKQSNIAP